MHVCYRLKRLDCFESSGYRLGHKAFYVLKDTDVVVALKSADDHKPIKPAAIHSLLHCQGLLPTSLLVDGSCLKWDVQSYVSSNKTSIKMETSENGFGGTEVMDNNVGNHEVSVSCIIVLLRLTVHCLLHAYFDSRKAI